MEQIWWEHVPNAIRFLQDVTDRLLEQKSLIMVSNGALPWYDDMVDVVSERLRQGNSSKSIAMIPGDDPECNDAGAYLLRHYCKPEKQSRFRMSKGYAPFLAESDDIVLHERFLWVRVVTREQLEDWSRFASEYVGLRGENKERAAFLIEWKGAGAPGNKQWKGIKRFSFHDYATDYDRIVFCTLMAATSNVWPFLKNYLTELVVNVAGDDIELCAACLRHEQEFLEAPYETICQIVQEEWRSDGTEYVYPLTEREVDRKVWLAQIRTVYPLLEEYRENYVAQHREEIARHLPITNTYGETYRVPEDVEIGMLEFMAKDVRVAMRVEDKERRRLTRFKEARNHLSHLETLSLEDIKELR